MGRVRICHVIECGATGALEMVLLMAEIQRTQGHAVLIAYSPRAGTPAGLRARIHPDVRLERLVMRPIPLHIAGWCRRYARLLRRWNPDVLHFHGARAGFMGRLVAGRRFGNRALYSPHCISLMHLDRSGIERALFRGLERLANGICNSIYVACCVPEQRVIDKEIGATTALLENAVEDGLLSRYAERTTGERERKRVVTCSRISAAKDPSLFADICGAVRAARPDIEFRWIGDGDAHRRKLLEDAGVRVTGWMSRSDALREVADGWIYLSTSAWEGLPVSVLEAILLKVPVLCRRAEWSEPVVRHDDTGFLFDNVDAASEMLIGHDTARPVAVAENAWKAARSRYSQTRFAAELARLYEPFEKRG